MTAKNVSTTDPAICRHALSARIEPPDAEGWMRESCGECGQILRWTLWPHHARALAATAEDGEGCTCATCANTCEGCGIEIAEADLVANEDGDAWHLGCLDVVEQVRHLQATPRRNTRMARNARADQRTSDWHDPRERACSACGGGGSEVDARGRHVDACRTCRGTGNA